MRISDWSSDVCSFDLHINIGLSDLQKQLIKIVKHVDYRLENNKESLEALCEIINHFIQDLPIQKEKILGIGMNQIGRASCRERECQNVYIWVVAESLKNKTSTRNTQFI